MWSLYTTSFRTLNLQNFCRYDLLDPSLENQAKALEDLPKVD
jgi:hypothetical protein